MPPTQKTEPDPNTDAESSKTKKIINNRVIDVTITELILTPMSCAHIVNEILKCLLYQKSQIPYPYDWLKTIVNKKRSTEETEHDVKRQNFTVSNHYREVSSTYDTMNEMMKAITKEFTYASSVIKEIVVVFGTIPQCAKQVYTIIVPNIARGHVEQNHIHDNLKHQHKVLRNIFLSEPWMDSVNLELNVLNTYIYLRKQQLNLAEESGDTFFVPGRPLSFSNVDKKTTINLNYVSSDVDTKCCHFEIFSDGGAISDSSSQTQDVQDAGSTSDMCWFAARSPVKGFKDCFINKVSASELW